MPCHAMQDGAAVWTTGVGLVQWNRKKDGTRTSRNLATQRSRQTDSPLVSWPSLYLGLMHLS